MRDEGSSVLLRFRQGDVDAFETLFHTHQRSVFGWALRIVRDRSAAEDVTIEAFWRMHQAHARFDSDRGFEPWARRIATHAALDWLRRQKPESQAPPEMLESTAAPATSDAAVSEEIRRKTLLAFSRLPPKLRMTALLAVVEERPHKEVAEALGITVPAVKLRVFRALRLLRKDLNAMGIKP
ncbi:MAG TPA: sigma-70 family RNA polymerase sigma factor [Terracidiphilus sp.]|jgi:RNA polymerase sigma-70 factor (ECF subfamily)